MFVSCVVDVQFSTTQHDNQYYSLVVILLYLPYNSIIVIVLPFSLSLEHSPHTHTLHTHSPDTFTPSHSLHIPAHKENLSLPIGTPILVSHSTTFIRPSPPPYVSSHLFPSLYHHPIYLSPTTHSILRVVVVPYRRMAVRH